MESIRQYILSVICVTVMCGLMQMLFSGGSEAAVKWITGLIITIVAIGPLMRGELRLNMNFDEIAVDSNLAIQEGEEAAFRIISQHIKEKTETYILDKAAELGVDISVDVELDADTTPSPDAVTIKGTVSPYAKKQLADCLQQELGIEEGKQTWIS